MRSSLWKVSPMGSSSRICDSISGLSSANSMNTRSKKWSMSNGLNQTSLVSQTPPATARTAPQAPDPAVGFSRAAAPQRSVASGSTHSSPEKREKSRSVVQSVAPCSIAIAASTASITRGPLT